MPRGTHPNSRSNLRPNSRKGTLNKNTREIKAIAQGMLSDPAYVAALKRRLLRGTAGAVEVVLYHYAYGKPKETVAVEMNTPVPLVIELLRPTVSGLPPAIDVRALPGAHD